MKIGQKLILGFVICFILSAVIGVVAVVQLARIKKDTIEIKIAENIEKEVLECRRQEKNIMLFGPYARATLEGVEEKTYLAKVNGHLISLRKLVEEGKKIAEEEEEEFNAILREIESYEASLKGFVVDYKEREEIIQKLEMLTKRLGRLSQAKTVSEEIIQIILALHGKKHHYIAYRDIQYVYELESEIAKLKKMVTDEEVTRYADDYLLLSGSLLKNTKRFDVSTLSMRKDARRVQEIARKIIGTAEKRIDVAHKTAEGLVGTILILAIAFGGGVGILLSKNITNPIGKLTTITGLIAKGDLSQRVDIKSKDEIGELANSFNKMTEDLKRLMEKEKELAAAAAAAAGEKKKAEELVSMNEELESTNEELKRTNEELESATEELRVANEEALKAKKMADEKAEKLEKMNKFMTGREFRMAELKEEVNTLLKELGRERKYRKEEKTDK